MKYIKKPQVVEAIKFTGENNRNIVDVYNFIEGANAESQSEIKSYGENFAIDFCNGTCRVGDILVKTHIGRMRARHGDYLVKTKSGEVFPCGPDEFKDAYETYEADSSGCQYCNGSEMLYYAESNGTWAGIYISNDELIADLLNDYASIKINRCPHCGCGLNKEQERETDSGVEEGLQKDEGGLTVEQKYLDEIANEGTDGLRRASKAVYFACVESVADDISARLKWAGRG